MELEGVSWVRYVPQWKGNRDLPEGERLSCEIKRPTGFDLMASALTEEELSAWRDETYGRFESNAGLWKTIQRMDTQMLRLLHRVVTNTRSLRGFVFGGTEITDAAEAWGRAPQPSIADIKEDQDTPFLLLEVAEQITKLANMTGDEVKNYASQCSGTATPTSGNATSAGEADPSAADTPSESGE